LVVCSNKRWGMLVLSTLVTWDMVEWLMRRMGLTCIELSFCANSHSKHLIYTGQDQHFISQGERHKHYRFDQ